MLFDDGPAACPFVAFEADRDRRSVEADHRHRCYAEPTPAPRAIAHQKRYCLAPEFAECPIFRDWAVRAAARPVPVPPAYGLAPMGGPEEAGPAAPVADEAAAEDESAATDESAAEDESAATDEAADEDERVEIERLPSVGPAEPALWGDEPELDAEPAAEAEPAADEEPPGGLEPASIAPPVAPTPPAAAQPPAIPDEPGPPLPAFLASRAAQLRDRPPTDTHAAAAAPVAVAPVSARVGRDDLVPSWERERIAGLDDRGSDLLGKITTVLIVLALASLAVLLIILAPGFLGGGGAQPTPPAVVGSPSPVPGATATPAATPEPTASPEPTPQVYVVQPGDTLEAIARRHGVTAQQLLAANPQITNPNFIQVGQRLTIPPDEFGLESPAP